MQLIPIINIENGATLTAAEWQSAGVETIACQLTPLCFKPGLDFFCKTPSLAAFFAWQGSLLLELDMKFNQKQQQFSLHSPLDGSKLKLSVAAVLALILKLKPDYLLLPKGLPRDCPILMQELQERTKLLLTLEDSRLCKDAGSGVYFESTEALFSFTKDNRDNLKQLLVYKGEVSDTVLESLYLSQCDAVVSNSPLNAACAGEVYTRSGQKKAAEFQEGEFAALDENCPCEACRLMLTPAYFAHLHLHTPLLSHRLLSAHNVTFFHQLFNQRE